jgi:hypothetical protein
MAWQVFFNNGVNVASGGSQLLNGLLTAIVNETDVQEEYANYKEKLAFTDEKALNIDQKFSSVAGPVEVDAINENGVKPEGERTKLPDKGFEIREYGEKLTTSFLMGEWLKTSKTLEGASDSVKQEWMTIARDGKYLIEAVAMRVCIDMIQVYTKGFGAPTSVSNAGSPTPKGLPLFSTKHTSRQGSIVWRNMGQAANLNAPFSAPALQDALDVHKNVIKAENGYKVRRPGVYDLIVSPYDEVAARKVLNENQSGAPTQFSGVGTNANQMNQFTFRGNKINLVVIEMLGDLDKHGNKIGNEKMWFVRNTDLIMKTRALKMIELYKPKMQNYQNQDTDAYIVDIRAGYACDHYGAELGIVGSKGDSDVAYTD